MDIRRNTVCTTVLFLIVACGGASTGESTTVAEISSTTSLSPDAVEATTTTEVAATTTTEDVMAGLEEAKSLMARPELADGGALEQNGAFAESTQGFTPFDGLEVFAYVDGENLAFYLEGTEELLRSIVIEFDAITEDSVVISDTSYVGDLAVDPPVWAIEAQNGNTLLVADYPPPEASLGTLVVMADELPQAQLVGNDTLGVHIASDILTIDEFHSVSIWIYSGFVNGMYSYAHYVQLFNELVENSSDMVVVAAFFTGVRGPAPPPLDWFFTSQG